MLPYTAADLLTVVRAGLAPEDRRRPGRRPGARPWPTISSIVASGYRRLRRLERPMQPDGVPAC